MKKKYAQKKLENQSNVIDVSDGESESHLCQFLYKSYVMITLMFLHNIIVVFICIYLLFYV